MEKERRRDRFLGLTKLLQFKHFKCDSLLIAIFTTQKPIQYFNQFLEVDPVGSWHAKYHAGVPPINQPIIMPLNPLPEEKALVKMIYIGEAGFHKNGGERMVARRRIVLMIAPAIAAPTP